MALVTVKKRVVTIGKTPNFATFQAVPNTKNPFLAARIITARKPHLANNAAPPLSHNVLINSSSQSDGVIVAVGDNPR